MPETRSSTPLEGRIASAVRQAPAYTPEHVVELRLVLAGISVTPKDVAA